MLYNLSNAGDKLEPLIFFRIIEVLQSTYKAGNLEITEQLSFLLLLMARFDVNFGECLNLIIVCSYKFVMLAETFYVLL